MADGEKDAAGEAAAAAWDAFCDGLRHIGRDLIAATADLPENERAEGLASLAQQTQQSLRWHVLGNDPLFPRLVEINDTPEVADNLFAPVSAEETYLLRGNIARLHDVNISVHAGWGFVPGADRRIWGDLGRKDLKVDAQGNFELRIGAHLEEGEGLRIEPGAAYLQIREYFMDWRTDGAGEFELLRLGSEGQAPAPPSLTRLAGALGDALAWIEGYHSTHQQIIRTTFPAEPNSVAVPQRRAGGNRNIQYGFGRFDLAPGEALLVSFDQPRARAWSVQWLNRWYELSDQENRPVGIVSPHAYVDTDGRVRLVIAPEDPGCPNWLDCNGHASGVFVVRWFWGEDDPPIDCEVVPLAELAGRLPADHPRSGREDRLAEQAVRRSCLARRRR